jgi:hypothetical protein
MLSRTLQHGSTVVCYLQGYLRDSRSVLAIKHSIQLLGVSEQCRVLESRGNELQGDWGTSHELRVVCKILVS